MWGEDVERLPEDEQAYDVSTMMASALLACSTNAPPPLFIMEHILRTAEDHFFRNLREEEFTFEKARAIGLRILESYDEDSNEDSQDGPIYMKLDDGVRILDEESAMDTSAEETSEEPEAETSEVPEEDPAEETSEEPGAETSEVPEEEPAEETSEEPEAETSEVPEEDPAEEAAAEEEEETSCCTGSCIPVRRFMDRVRAWISRLFR
ncbi:uncharacterized protein [Engystomops pustulosus]|uniref:uncharacterized protein n=1 Tax=Engystomops pustulosus TaxID=76066 RepID=UPI003AFA4810